MEKMLLEQPVKIRDLDHVRLREWLDNLSPAERQRSQYLSVLRHKLSEGEVVAAEAIPRDLVTMNSLVGLRDLGLNEKFTCFLSYPDEANLSQRKVSVAVPLGTEMLGRPVGATITCRVTSGIRQLRIERVYYQPEAAGDHHL